MNLDMVPDITMRGQDDPHARPVAPRPPTVGRLAARLHDLAGRPGDWWHLVVFDPAAPVTVPLGEEHGARLWLTTWPPGHRAARRERHGVTMLAAGELTEVTVSAAGATERTLRPNRVRVHGTAGTPEPLAHDLLNPGPAYAISLHATLLP